VCKVCHDEIVSVVQNVNAMLEQHKTEKAEVTRKLSQLTEERQLFQDRIEELEEHLSIALKANCSVSTVF
jgi:predicted house-cleaning noncanonical NTP pyrophosphatase (MazG superfamily)